MFGAVSSDVRGDLEPADPIAVNLLAIAAVGVGVPGALHRMSLFAADRRDGLDQRDQLGALALILLRGGWSARRVAVGVRPLVL